jgi:7,8-dihydropterin-6-yl-methyl-4-(beta-D-ribofuranosyl)aminobenzene 5'-phosphate synthase
MRIKVIFDKSSLDKNLRIGWGVAFLVDDKILFDTGEKGEWLIENMRSLGVDIKKIEAVVISHDHWDHTGGLWEILKAKKGLKVYVCPRFSKEFKDKVKESQAELIENEKTAEISQDIFVTGEIAGAYHGKYMPEQAIVLKTKNGLTVITGCAHPGILKIIEKVKVKFPNETIYFVLGGFHLMESDKRAVEIVVDEFKKKGVLKAGPTHCSGETAENIFKKYYEGNFVSIKVGQNIEV